MTAGHKSFGRSSAKEILASRQISHACPDPQRIRQTHRTTNHKQNTNQSQQMMEMVFVVIHIPCSNSIKSSHYRVEDNFEKQSESLKPDFKPWSPVQL
jgi:hypothetical protein